MSSLLRIFYMPMIGYRWVKALDLSARGAFDDAIKQLEYLGKHLEHKDIEYHLLNGFVRFASGDDKKAIDNFRISVSMLDQATGYTDDEIKYLKCYAGVFGNNAINSLPGKDVAFEEVSFDLINLANVRQALKKNFPLKDHPEWVNNTC